MFRSSLNRILDWAETALAPSEEEWAADGSLSGTPDDRRAAAAPHPHPHRRELRWERRRRPGSVPHPPAHCISPVRRTTGARTRQDSTR